MAKETAVDKEAWTAISERSGPSGFIEVKTVTFELPDGVRVDWDLVTGPDVVAVLALTTRDDVVLARQFRPGPGLVLEELPGGLIDEGETPHQAAVRELAEETGYEGSVEIVGSYLPGASMTRRNWVAVATRCEVAASQSLDAYERIAVVTRPLSELRRALSSGQLTDTAAAYMALDHLGAL